MQRITKKAPKASELIRDTEELEIERVEIISVDLSDTDEVNQIEEKPSTLDLLEEDVEALKQFEDQLLTGWDISSSAEVPLELEENWDLEAWIEQWQNQDPNQFPELPPELEERLERTLPKQQLNRDQFIFQAIANACKEWELKELREKGKREGEEAVLIVDPKNGKYRCFPADYFSKEALAYFEVVPGKYYPIRWQKTQAGWEKVQTGYFQAADLRQAAYVLIRDGKAVGNWEKTPISFLDDGWKWGIYDQSQIVEVKGRKEEYGALYYDVWIDNERVDSVLTVQEVLDILPK
ncbi:hypothetical protein [Risungbinella massiliensis]|uniref:hypothetical protein n=1 Tax=Risungbinella massiliensis TaxID=1329796 RepID=UPI0005CC5BE7|nr:hypothetical protein [Risungbinella massiliensis]